MPSKSYSKVRGIFAAMSVYKWFDLDDKMRRNGKQDPQVFLNLFISPMSI